MRFILLVGLCGFCIIGDVISRPSGETEILLTKGVDLPELQKCNTMSQKMGFMGMNLDCQLMILDDMHTYELLILAETKRELSYVVGDVLRRKFARKSMTCLSSTATKYDRNNVEEHADEIIIKHNSICAGVLTNYGHFISNLRISHEHKVPAAEAKVIFAATNSYCSETLRELHISNKNDIFVEFKRPFERVEHVSLEGRFQHLSSSKLTFSELFPAMRTLTLANVVFQESNWLDQNFPQLEHLSADIWSDFRSTMTTWRLNEVSIKRLIRNNPQIKGLTLKFVNPKILRIVADELPELEHLELVYYDEKGRNNISPIHFEHLKSLSVNKGALTVPSSILMGELEEFETNGLSSEWFDLIRDEKSLRKLHIHRKLNEMEVMELAKVGSNLVEIDIECGSDVSANSLVKLANKKNLEQLILFTPWTISWPEIFDVLQEKFAHDWNIIQTEFYIHLTHKNDFSS